MARYLTKSRFKLALECPTKLFYTGKDEYVNKSHDNPFLEALADGGHQVGELAKLYWPGGVMIDDLDYKTSLDKTNELLKKEKVIIYEGAFSFHNFFIRADIIVKNGNDISLYEVKAKSYKKEDDKNFLKSKKNGNQNLIPKWKPYLYDVAFQKLVISRAFPDYSVHSFLVLADKDSTTTVDGLNQKFMIEKCGHGRISVKVMGETDEKALGKRILTAVPTDEAVDYIYKGKEFPLGKSFEEYADFLAEHFVKDKKIPHPISTHCKECEFKATEIELATGHKSGFRKCWKEKANFSDEDFTRQTILDIWNFRKTDPFLQKGTFFMEEITRDDLDSKSKNKCDEGLSPVDRQWLQVKKYRENDPTPYIDKEGLKKEMDSWC